MQRREDQMLQALCLTVIIKNQVEKYIYLPYILAHLVYFLFVKVFIWWSAETDKFNTRIWKKTSWNLGKQQEKSVKNEHTDYQSSFF